MVCCVNPSLDAELIDAQGGILLNCVLAIFCLRKLNKAAGPARTSLNTVALHCFPIVFIHALICFGSLLDEFEINLRAFHPNVRV